jgi:hypothetical protein
LTINFKRLGDFDKVLGVGFSKIVQETAALGDDLEQTTARVLIFFVNLEVVGEFLDWVERRAIEGEPVSLDLRQICDVGLRLI